MTYHSLVVNPRYVGSAQDVTRSCGTVRSTHRVSNEPIVLASFSTPSKKGKVREELTWLVRKYTNTQTHHNNTTTTSRSIYINITFPYSLLNLILFYYNNHLLQLHKSIQKQHSPCYPLTRKSWLRVLHLELRLGSSGKLLTCMSRSRHRQWMRQKQDH